MKSARFAAIVAAAAMATMAVAQSLTTAPPDNGSGGVFMNLTNVRGPVSITQFDVAYTGTVGDPVDVEVWTRPGSYVGFESDPSSWTLNQRVSGVKMGATTLSPLELTSPLLVDGETAVYIHAVGPSTGGIRYTGTAASPPQTMWANDDLELFSDVARTGLTPFAGSAFTPRTFAGTIHYQLHDTVQPAVVGYTGGSPFDIFYGGSTGDVVGYRFEVTEPITVTHLGVWNATTGGLSTSHRAGIWDQSQTLLTDNVVMPTSEIIGDWRYEPTSPVVLVPGVIYTAGAMYAAGDGDSYLSSPTTVDTAPEVSILNGVEPGAGSLGFVYPQADSTNRARFGPNFLLEGGGGTLITINISGVAVDLGIPIDLEGTMHVDSETGLGFGVVLPDPLAKKIPKVWRKIIKILIFIIKIFFGLDQYPSVVDLAAGHVAGTIVEDDGSTRITTTFELRMTGKTTADLTIHIVAEYDPAVILTGVWSSSEIVVNDRPGFASATGKAVFATPAGQEIIAPYTASYEFVGDPMGELEFPYHLSQEVDFDLLTGEFRAQMRGTVLICYADCDSSGSLDFFDFLCFQNAFASGDPYADCDGSGQLDFFDFLCFQNAFAAGCP